MWNIEEPRNVKLIYDVLKFSPPEIEPAVLFATNNALVCETPDDAMKVAYEIDRSRYDALALDGTFYQKSGIISGGSHDLARKAKRWDEKHMAQLKLQKEKITEELKEVMKKTRRQGELTTVESQIRGLENRLKYSLNDLETSKKNINEYDKQLEDFSRELDKIGPKISEIERRMQQRDMKIQDIKESMNNVEDDVYAEFCARIGVANIRQFEERELVLQQERAKKRAEFEQQIDRINNNLEFERSKDTSKNVQRWERAVQDDEDSLETFKQAEARQRQEIEKDKEKIEVMKQEKATHKSLVDQMEEEMAKARRDVQALAKELAAIHQSIANIETRIESMKSKRQTILMQAKMESIEIPLLQGSMDDIGQQQQQQGQGGQGGGGQDFPTDERESRIEIDYRKLEQHLKNLSDPDQIKKSGDSLAKELQAKLDTLEKIQTPNMKAMQKLDRVTEKIQSTNEEFEAARKKAKKAKAAFEKVKNERCTLFTNCCNHISDAIDAIYKQLSRNEAAQAYLGPDNPEEPYLDGINYNCVAPGKRFQPMSNLSGGEKTIAALALLFAIHSFQPAPFFVLDEIDAALDNTNIGKVASYIREKTTNLQTIVISLKEEFYSHADVLIGICPEPAECLVSQTILFDLENYDGINVRLFKIERGGSTTEADEIFHPGGLIAAELLRPAYPIEVRWGNETSIAYSTRTLACITNNDVLRALARVVPGFRLYGETPIERTQIDHWLTYTLSMEKDPSDELKYLNKCLGPLTFLVANHLTIADLAVFNELYVRYEQLKKIGIPQHVQRWYNLILTQTCTKQALSKHADELRAAVSAAATSSSGKTKEPSPDKSGMETGAGKREQGKFVDLPGAEMGKVVVRFPPEASGYLHIGHAKAALLNQYYQQAFQGKLIMRFDDTNPAKENVHFEQVILEDLEMLQIKPDLFTHTSQYFDLMLDYCVRLIKEGKAYVDDTEPEQMKKEREERVESKNRNNTPDRNLAMWAEMVKGSEAGQKCCVRAKIDMSSANGCMRDPTIYRCKNEPHPRTGTQYKVYPTYDFACPIVDAIENVTHTLRTMEYHDRDEQFYWFIEALGLRRPYIWEYSRLNMTNTVLSKRKLTWFVAEGLVDGWDDPRFPTVRGILRRGMTVEGLREFIIAQGSSKSVVFMEWDKIWAFNKKVIDPIAPRYTALENEGRVPVNVAGVQPGTMQAAVHPKNAEIGMKTVHYGPRVLIDLADAKELKEGENATFINWGNLMIQKVIRGTDGVPVSIDATPNLDNKDYKKTLKLTWLCELPADQYTPTFCVYFEHIISKAVLGKDEDFKNYIGHQTRTEVPMLGDPELKRLKKGDIIQLQRRGFFKVDQAYQPASEFSGAETPIVLFAIPDGHVTAVPTANVPKKETTGESKKSKQQAAVKQPAGASDAFQLNESIIQQGEKVRKLKADKAPKADVDAAVKVLLDLKAQYKAQTGGDWKPGVPVVATAATSAVAGASCDAESLNGKIVEQGNLVRDLKAKKAANPEVDAAVKALLDLKAQYKAATGSDWKPGAVVASTAAAPQSSSAAPSGGAAGEINEQIVQQGNLVRDLKAKKAAKPEVDAAVKTLLELKAQYKTATGSDWKPGAVVTPAAPQATNAGALKPSNSGNVAGDSAETINKKIIAQGDLVRELKGKKAPKAEVDAQVKTLLDLKAQYKQATGGQEWKPGCVPPAVVKEEPTNQTTSSGGEADLLSQITAQGDKVRSLKSSKAEKAVIDSAVADLLKLKANYKTLTGKDWKPGATVSPITAVPVKEEKENMSPASGAELAEKITKQGEAVRSLKSSGAAKPDVDAAVKILLDLKAEYKKVTGTDYAPPGGAGGRPQSKPSGGGGAKKESKPKPEQKPKQQPTKDDGTGPKKQTRLGLEATKEDNLPDWYSQVITKGEMIEYYDVSGCYILRHWSFAIWKAIRNWFDAEITKLGVKECYFPIFVSRAALEREKTHIADFAPEVAWVTKSGDSDLAEPIAVRPTSETVMYPAYAKWIQSYRDLPIRLNQWNNVVRWEFKHPQPFLRTREFLWQEGHTAFASKKEADEEVLTILDLYAKVYTDLLAIPVVKGRKTEKEKFAGGDYTTTVEAYISASGRAIQGATSHHLGQNFSRMFDIVYEHPETKEKEYVYQNSWGITTRTIGVMIMVHADNQGLVLPPRVACIQVVIVPCGITATTNDDERRRLYDSCRELERTIVSAGIRCEGDYRDNYSPGWKYNHWELKGVPVRIELGFKDLQNDQFVAVRRDNGAKQTIKRDRAAVELPQLLETIHASMYKRAEGDLRAHTKVTKQWAEFLQFLETKNIIMSPFCGEIACEDRIKAESARDDAEAEAGAPAMGAKSLCIPFEQPAKIDPAVDKCVHPACGRAAKFYTLFGRSY
uniref:Bifunctional glutamate/proline--tRNA ligase n=1 Tax=Anopheles epiroticus TaxID=199890 RepID=A0A182P6L4_9DIPT